MIEASRALLNALIDETATEHLFLYLDHPDGAVRAWSGIGDTEWNGFTWPGVGQFGSVDRIAETSELQAFAMSFTLSGVATDLIEFASTKVRNRTAELYVRWHDIDGAWFDDGMPGDVNVRLLFRGKMDFTTSEDDGRTGRIAVTTSSPISDWDKASNVAYTNEEQVNRFMSDTGLDRITELVDKEITGWAAS